VAVERTGRSPSAPADLRLSAAACWRRLLIDAWTGLRWSELRAMSVRDFVEVSLPILVVQRAEPEGVEIKSTSPERPVAFRLPTASCRSCEPWRLTGTQTPVYS
jgi:hypothetical protein